MPYCDSFAVCEEWFLESPDPASQPVIKSCVLRVGYKLTWYKSTMMKGTITKASNSEVEAVMKEYVQKMITDRNITF